jgi:hypothetical protein
MSTQLKLFSAREPESFANLEKEVNDWLAAKGDSIQPVNSQTATCAIKIGSDDHQAVIIALWYLDPPNNRTFTRLTRLAIAAAPALFVLLWSTGFIGVRYGLPGSGE